MTNYVCTSCGGTLKTRGYSDRDEILFTCSSCGEKFQGKEKFGFMHIYQVNKPKYRGGKKLYSVRLYDWQKANADKIGGLQKAVDEKLGEPE